MGLLTSDLRLLCSGQLQAVGAQMLCVRLPAMPPVCSSAPNTSATGPCARRQVMGLIELIPLKNTMVGNPGSGLSVEQRKRLTIAVELTANPSIVFADEPTSGGLHGTALRVSCILPQPPPSVALLLLTVLSQPACLVTMCRRGSVWCELE